MRRRNFITLLGGAVVARPLMARAQQQAKIARIGFLITGSLAEPRVNIAAFRQGLIELGYREGENFTLEPRGANGRIELLPRLAKELVALKVDVIVAAATPAGRAARDATTTIPIVVSAMGDPVSDGLVASLARPAGISRGRLFWSGARPQASDYSETIASRSFPGGRSLAFHSVQRPHER